MTEREILTAKQAAEFLGLTPLTVCKYARLGVLPGRKIGKDWRFVKVDLLSWIRGESGQGANETQKKA